MVKYYVKSHKRKAYRRSDGSRVKASSVKGHWVKTKGSGRSRGRKTGKFSKSPKWIQRKGKLGGKGFLSKSPAEQHRLLNKCVKNYGYRSCLGSVMVLERSKSIESKHGKKLRSLRNYLKNKYSRSFH